MIYRQGCIVGIFLAVVIILRSCENVDSALNRRSSGTLRKCGNNGKDFMRWFCKDASFDFPFPFNRIHIIFRYRAPFKDLYPFQHQAAVCCRTGCNESGYKRMCYFHKKIRRCEMAMNMFSGRKTSRRVHARCRSALAILS
ncbi:uncharacterized protein LOC120341107 [Styela clava]